MAVLRGWLGAFRVVLAQPFSVLLGLDCFEPFGILEVPVDSLADAGGERLARGPAEFVGDPAGIDSVATVVARTIFDEFDLLAVAFGVISWLQFVQQVADRMDDVHVRHFVVSADIVRAAKFASGDCSGDRGAVVVDVEPVSDLLTVAVNRKGFAGQGVHDH